MAFKLKSTTGNNKVYLWQAAELGNGVKEWIYVTTDTPATVAISGYIDGDADNADMDQLIDSMSVGDFVRVIQVAAIDDDQTVQEDMAGGIVDISEHVVLVNDGGHINLSEDLLGATVTYTA